MITAIVGANWGDEGKGKLTDVLAAEADIVVRFQGGANAGHTIKNSYGKFALHSLPGGVFHANTLNIIGNGVALDIPQVVAELQQLQQGGVPKPQLLISNRAHVVMPYHKLLDAYEEQRLGSHSFGSTKSGIAPLYSDKYAKIGFQLCELYDDDLLRQRLQSVLEIKNLLLRELYHQPELEYTAVYAQMRQERESIREWVADTQSVLHHATRQGKHILLEGQLGALKDTDMGIYPMVTSSSTLAGFGSVGAGVPPQAISRIIAVVKAYSSAVGAGAFVSEIFGQEAEHLRQIGGDGGEYGATTGRPRRMGWFDAVATRYGCMVQGATEAAVTVLDALSGYESIPVCVGYEIGGAVTTEFPVTPLLHSAKPVYQTLPGWQQDITGIRDFDRLPTAAKDYVRFIEDAIGVPVRLISNGPSREDIIYR
ncbi:adenylosuccinate synthase [Eubacteriales bacterium OttesenSCG-928-N14]|nr:adenylosuccinate synthase [Eubacteriales bacterium OttesenSCG-928-N14]